MQAANILTKPITTAEKSGSLFHSYPTLLILFNIVALLAATFAVLRQTNIFKSGLGRGLRISLLSERNVPGTSSRFLPSALQRPNQSLRHLISCISHPTQGPSAAPPRAYQPNAPSNAHPTAQPPVRNKTNFTFSHPLLAHIVAGRPCHLSKARFPRTAGLKSNPLMVEVCCSPNAKLSDCARSKPIIPTNRGIIANSVSSFPVSKPVLIWISLPCMGGVHHGAL